MTVDLITERNRIWSRAKAVDAEIERIWPTIEKLYAERTQLLIEHARITERIKGENEDGNDSDTR